MSIEYVSSPLDVKDIAKLIRLCKANGVSSLKYEGLELSMAQTDNLAIAPLPQARGSATKALRIAEDVSRQMKFEDSEELISTLMLQDPAAYEQMLAAGELEEEVHR